MRARDATRFCIRTRLVDFLNFNLLQSASTSAATLGSWCCPRFELLFPVVMRLKPIPKNAGTPISVKKRRLVSIDDSEDESHPNASGMRSKKTTKRQKRKWSGTSGPDPELLEQRKQLPIWKGESTVALLV